MASTNTDAAIARVRQLGFGSLAIHQAAQEYGFESASDLATIMAKRSAKVRQAKKQRRPYTQQTPSVPKKDWMQEWEEKHDN